jgi:hypothetical protein
MSAPQRSPQETAAHQYADTGWPVFPCRDGSKEPATGHGFQDATTDHRQIGRWWSAGPDRNVAIATGRPGPDVVDVDVKPEGSGFAALGELKRAGLVDGYHAMVTTPGRGYHLYYAGTEQGNGRLRDHFLDFRSAGGYVVAPPSRDPRGGYEVVQHSPATGRTVSWRAIREHLQPQASRERAVPQRQHEADGDTGRLGRLAGWLEHREPGDRNFPLFYAAKQAALSGLLDGPGEQRLIEASLRSGLRGGEAEARRTIASGRRAADREASPGRPFARTPQREAEAG